MTIYATPAQTMQALRDLSEEDMTLLLRAAADFTDGTEFNEPQDLLNEAIWRLLRPSVPGVLPKPRRWPLHVRFAPFLHMVMRSLANCSRRLARNAPGSHLDIDPELGAPADEDETPPPPVHERLRTRSAGDEAEERQRGRLATLAAEQAREALKGDHDAQRVIDGMLACLEPAECCAEFGIVPELYEPARKRAARALRRRARSLFGALQDLPARVSEEDMDA